MVPPAGNYMCKVNNKNTRTRCEICSKLTIKTSERRHWRGSGVFIVNFEHISNLVLVLLLPVRLCSICFCYYGFHSLQSFEILAVEPA